MDFLRQHVQRQIFHIMFFYVVFRLQDIFFVAVYGHVSDSVQVSFKFPLKHRFHFPKAFARPAFFQQFFHLGFVARQIKGLAPLLHESGRRAEIETGVFLFSLGQTQNQPSVLPAGFFHQLLILGHRRVEKLLPQFPQHMGVASAAEHLFA